MTRFHHVLTVASAAAALALAAPALAGADGPPQVIPVVGQTTSNYGVTDCTPLTPATFDPCYETPALRWLPRQGNAGVPGNWLSEGDNFPAGFRATAIYPGSYVTMSGELRTECPPPGANGADPGQCTPLIWEDLGAGFPQSASLGLWQFLNPGVYRFKCNCLDLYDGRVYVIGPRPVVKATRTAPDNTNPPVTYQFDGSESFVTDFQPPAPAPFPTITNYEWDLDNDGTFEFSSPEPLVQGSLPVGDQVVKLRTTDSTGRRHTFAQLIQVPDPRPKPPNPAPIIDDAAGSRVISGVKFPKANVRIKASKRAKVGVIRRKGLTVTVTGLADGDRVNARLLSGKTTVASAERRTSARSTLTVRMRAGKKGKKMLKRKKQPKTLRLVVKVTGEDFFTVTRTARVRVSR